MSTESHQSRLPAIEAQLAQNGRYLERQIVMLEALCTHYGLPVPTAED
ncbi:hypothetical protein [Nocardia yunnanensis]|nr:hypothetical protein [Nocardia yunnanensis]